MKELKVCIGSACHLKGSYDVIEGFKKLISDNGVEDRISLKAAFCLGHCTEAVSVEKWDGTILSVSKDNIEDIFKNQILCDL
ncbi:MULTISPECIES: (2Fe-2S) ferredoxin domain-containing protein [Clostridium]|uniref:Thioredoxin-like [2Fe-2S] ferredoxin n=1 Tax=Clostridium cadaveris TaxID=1529 RepID=A0A1I2PJ97_9CLOT|nr:NAD(P)H-dependent oxidoreductase subunit E [Clostridium cadaveris]MDU4953220.1 NAD(P)H-dependent oxidoreductase subunit E [Clostridium sp.]MDM8311742.1 NAD(P)H-dependent oxidoreductase subunit E [Clostridium cadaveris]MDY4947976.1 NAD(P)H-dependent oxidoreductase subunit E [Clostridium cadaveris]NME65985.1 (2Fe-2S) ferredoxin domain-containing protein [Clostridium cadaveris]NWK09723.1 NAD(P)H-dependent oxidoreductase subunit E [Clostridium cadaveris]